MILLRKNINSKSLQLIISTMHMLEYFVNYCGENFHNMLDNEGFLSDIGKVAVKMFKRPIVKENDCGRVIVDIVEAWGMAFLPIQSQYPNIPKLYFDLKKQGLPFPEKPFDATRVTIFDEHGSYKGYIPSNSNNSNNNPDTDNDAMIAAALAEYPNVVKVKGALPSMNFFSSSNAKDNNATASNSKALSSLGNGDSTSRFSDLAATSNEINELLSTSISPIPIDTDLGTPMALNASNSQNNLASNVDALYHTLAFYKDLVLDCPSETHYLQNLTATTEVMSNVKNLQKSIYRLLETETLTNPTVRCC